jgi:methylenetetrahydrofolate--tRNA-(uracil-5-)-methyltransferase
VSDRVTIVGGGLAGCEAAWQLARAGVPVDLFEMRPEHGTAAHVTHHLGELVCSNSFRNATLETAVGLLKDEMRAIGSLVMRVADAHRVPAGACLAVDRVGFAEALTAAIEAEPLVRIVRAEITAIPDGVAILATGPLTSPALSDALGQVLGATHLYFYDAIAPTITCDSLDMTVAWRQSRYDKGGEDYVNCPLDRERYYAFVDAVLARDFERVVYFEGCMPIEEMARRGRDTLAFGPMRPVGLVDPRTGGRPFAAVQLRQDDAAGTLYNMVGFQTKMTYPEQRRVLRMIPGLERAEFVRLGSLHRNTYVNAPELLLPSLQVTTRKSLFLAGQIVGVEGYVESAAMGILAGMNAVRLLRGEPMAVPPRTTALGSLVAYLTERGRKSFQPMNANYGLFPPLPRALRGREKKLAMAERGLGDVRRWYDGLGGGGAGTVSVA